MPGFGSAHTERRLLMNDEIARMVRDLLNTVEPQDVSKAGAFSCVHGRFIERPCEGCEKDSRALHMFLNAVKKMVA